MHAHRGRILRWVLLAFLAVVGARRLAAGRSLRRSTSGGGAREGRTGAVAVALQVLLVAGAVAVLVCVFLTGDAGARTVWGRLARRVEAGVLAPARSSPVRLSTPADRASSSRRNDSTRSGSASPRATASSRPHSGSSAPWVQPRGQSSVISSRSGNASIRSSGRTWASPNDRIPGVSMIQPSMPAGLVGQGQHQRRRRRVPSAAGDGVHDADVAVRRRGSAR